MAKRTLLVFQKDDEKARMWARALQDRGVDGCGLSGSPIAMPIKLLCILSRKGRPAGFFFRYLNDYPGLMRTLCRVVSEIGVIVLCKIGKIPVFWVCHNVDRESVEMYPRVTAFRRRMIAASSRRIFVMDPLLLPHAERVLKPRHGQLDFLTFGELAPRILTEQAATLNSQVLEFCISCRNRSKGDLTFVGLCVGDTGAKYAHFEYVPALIEKAGQLGIDLFMVIAGNFRSPSSGLSQATLKTLQEHPNVFFHPSAFNLDERMLVDEVDFIWRGYRDLSVAYTLYVGASVGLPVLALNMGFVGEAVNYYGLGATVESDLNNLYEALQHVKHWNTDYGRKFLVEHNWETAAERMVAAIGAGSHSVERSLEVSGR